MQQCWVMSDFLGYARVSTAEQTAALQEHALRAAGCSRIWSAQRYQDGPSAGPPERTERVVSDNPPYEPGAAVAAASEVLRQAVRENTATMQSPDTEDLYTLGATLDELTRALATLVATCSTQVAGLSGGAVLRDDSGTRDPAARCAEAADHLHQVAQHLDAANQAARQYHSAISHVGVEVPW